MHLPLQDLTPIKNQGGTGVAGVHEPLHGVATNVGGQGISLGNAGMEEHGT